jgi:chorismate mutase
MSDEAVRAEESDVDELRKDIASADQEIVALIARRLELVRILGTEKARRGIATADPAREAAVLRAVAEAARSAGVDEERVREIFWCIIDMSRAAQRERSTA